MKTFEKYGVRIPQILLPKKLNLESWSVIACDQYTQDADYWKKTEEIANGKESSLNLIFPEVYLGKENEQARIQKIHDTMTQYLENGIFDEKNAAVYVERTTEFGRVRRGLVVAIDLEDYEWKPGSKSLIRATEATVPERLPPRMKIRKGAALELPHIMLLADDSKNLLLGGLEKVAKKNPPLYSGNLMHGSGSICGWGVCGEESEAIFDEAIKNLAENGKQSDRSVFLFAVGDGNHSLATAKAVWDEYKKDLSDAEKENSRVRFALVEIVNIYDSGLTFEPIHRVVLNHESQILIDFLQKKLDGERKEFATEEELCAFVEEKSDGARYGFCADGKFFALQTKNRDLAIAPLQSALDEFICENGGKKEDIDYIHGTKDTIRLGKTKNQTAILLPPIAKDSFFQTIARRGVLPRKSFSMGEASEKRFYVESRRLF